MTRIANFYSIRACSNRNLTLSAICKLIELSLHEHVTTVEFTKILSQYLAFTSKKIKLIFLQMPASDLLEASFQLTTFKF